MRSINNTEQFIKAKQVMAAQERQKVRHNPVALSQDFSGNSGELLQKIFSKNTSKVPIINNKPINPLN